MNQQNQPSKEQQQRITAELANQAHSEPGSAEENEAKENRAKAEGNLTKPKHP